MTQTHILPREQNQMVAVFHRLFFFNDTYQTFISTRSLFRCCFRTIGFVLHFLLQQFLFAFCIENTSRIRRYGDETLMNFPFGIFFSDSFLLNISYGWLCLFVSLFNSKTLPSIKHSYAYLFDMWCTLGPFHWDVYLYTHTIFLNLIEFRPPI